MVDAAARGCMAEKPTAAREASPTRPRAATVAKIMAATEAVGRGHLENLDAEDGDVGKIQMSLGGRYRHIGNRIDVARFSRKIQIRLCDHVRNPFKEPGSPEPNNKERVLGGATGETRNVEYV